MRTARTESAPVADGPRTLPAAAARGRPCGPAEVIDADDHLVGRVAGGDAGAWPVLVERHLGAVVGFASAVLGDRAEAEDVAQETFVRLMRKAPDWRPGGAKLRTWLFRVAMNLSTDRWRKAKRARGDPSASASLASLGGPGESGVIRPLDQARAVRGALRALPERQRVAIALVHYRGLANREAAHILGVSVDALESLLARGRRAIRRELGPLVRDLLGES